jgi:cytochrome c
MACHSLPAGYRKALSEIVWETLCRLKRWGVWQRFSGALEGRITIRFQWRKNWDMPLLGIREAFFVRGHSRMKRNFLLGAVALGSLVTVSACGGGAGEAPAPTEETTTVEPEAPAEEEAATEEAATEEAAADAGAGATAGFAGMTTDIKAGERVFALCRSCHVLDEGVNRVGPSLHNIVGRKSGTVAGFAYSDANKNSGVTWTTDVMFEYLADPKAFMPGTKMAFPGIKNPQDRANLIAYLESTKS